MGNGVRLSRKVREHDQGDPPIEPYDPYGLGQKAVEDVTHDAPDVTHNGAPVTDDSEGFAR